MLKEVLPQLSAQFYNVRESESFIKHYPGIDGVKNVYETILAELFSERRSQIELDFRLILQDSQHARSYRLKERLAQGVLKFLPQERQINTCVIVLPDKFVIVQLVQPPMVMVIENPHVIHSNRLMFELMWEALPQPNER